MASNPMQESPLRTLTDQIAIAADNGLDLIAIGMAVALPALCASLATVDGRAQGKQYKAWCETNLTDGAFSFLSAEDLYSIRCGMLHQGRFGDLQHTVSRVVFVPKGGASVTNCMYNNVYLYGVVEFCKNMCDAVNVWYEANKTDPIIKANSLKMMRYYPNGLSPRIALGAVIA